MHRLLYYYYIIKYWYKYFRNRSYVYYSIVYIIKYNICTTFHQGSDDLFFYDLIVVSFIKSYEHKEEIFIY